MATARSKARWMEPEMAPHSALWWVTQLDNAWATDWDDQRVALSARQMEQQMVAPKEHQTASHSASLSVKMKEYVKALNWTVVPKAH